MDEEKDNIFSENNLKDPFREDLWIYEKKEHPEKNISEQSEKVTGKKEKRTLKNIFRDSIRQIIASAIILLIGFFLLNGSAYYKIIKSKWQDYFDTKQESPLVELVETDISEPAEVLETSSDPEVQKKQIPDLDMEITPIDDRLIIPRIDQNIPVIRVSSQKLIERDWDALEAEMQEALKDGVVHYPGTSLPDQAGNVVITGHSSYFPWDPGRFKDVFALLHEVIVGDKIVVYYDQEKYIYEVTEKKIVLPQDIEVLKQTPNDRLTLITCTPVGTNLKRLIIIAEPISKPIITLDEKDKVLR